MKSGIYQILNVATGKIYIGSSTNVFRRCRQHHRRLSKNRHPNKHLQNAWNKYGEQSFEYSTLELVGNFKEELLEIEQKYLFSLKPHNREIGYNLSPTASSTLGSKRSVESRKKISESQLGRTPWNKGKTLSKAHRQKLRQAKLGDKNPKYWLGRKHSEETKEKIRQANTDKNLTEETKEKIRIANSIPVIRIDPTTGEEKYYPSMTDARQEGFSVTCIGYCCKGERKTHGGFRWKYANK